MALSRKLRDKAMQLSKIFKKGGEKKIVDSI
jgi:hypothetical protein